MESPTDKYENLFGGLNTYGTLAEAEETLRKIDELYRKFQQAGDRTGVRFARQAAQRIKRNTTALSQSPKLTPEAQMKMGEIAQWVTVWLQTPDIFSQWLALRKAAAEFKKLFGAADSGQ
jgi:hypothetical protein